MMMAKSETTNSMEVSGVGVLPVPVRQISDYAERPIHRPPHPLALLASVSPSQSAHSLVPVQMWKGGEPQCRCRTWHRRAEPRVPTHRVSQCLAVTRGDRDCEVERVQVLENHRPLRGLRARCPGGAQVLGGSNRPQCTEQPALTNNRYVIGPARLPAQSRCRCGTGGPSPGADVATVSRVPVQMWRGRAESRRRCGRREPSLGADVAGLSTT